ncbi:glutamine-dependent NAD(+) synthetase [bacterium BMS3Abin01]|nr:glutamine-dependent NAD(+) synthetase [bacterium BMS3Abin01]
MKSIRLALGQIDSTVGDFHANVDKIGEYIGRAADMGADLVVFPELALTGYPPEDLTFNPDFIRANTQALERLLPLTDGIVAVVGFLDGINPVRNAAAVLAGGRVAGVCHKMRLPNYGVFDEFRYFSAGKRPTAFEYGGRLIGISICEDIWYPDDPAGSQVAAGAVLLLNISSSPYRVGRTRAREEMLKTRSSDYVTPVALVNMVGGQDELVFDGNSLVYNEYGELIARGRSLEEDLILVDIDFDEVQESRRQDASHRLDGIVTRYPGPIHSFSLGVKPPSESGEPRRAMAVRLPEPLAGSAEAYQALKLGLGDYVRKNGFKKVVIGMSGGIDSSLTAVIAVDALGSDNVVGVSMPSRYTSTETRDDAEVLASRLGIEFRAVPIEAIFSAYLETLAPEFQGREEDVTEENLQARIRGNILMALSNKFGWMVLATGNKSETSVGYCTLYGDMAGGYAVLKDVPKTMVYELSRYRNSLGEKVIPESVIAREPSAELAPDQKDSDSLPPYELLDRIIEDYVEYDRSIKEMVASGLDEETVRRVVKMIDRNEYKRRQAPPGIKMTSRAFGKDRRFPITNRFQA